MKYFLVFFLSLVYFPAIAHESTQIFSTPGVYISEDEYQDPNTPIYDIPPVGASSNNSIEPTPAINKASYKKAKIKREKRRLETQLNYYKGRCYSEHDDSFCVEQHNILIDKLYLLEKEPDEYFEQKLVGEQVERENQKKAVDKILNPKPRIAIDPHTGKPVLILN